MCDTMSWEALWEFSTKEALLLQLVMLHDMGWAIGICWANISAEFVERKQIEITRV